jgi:phosphoglycerate dehydrogenase-like enzyme
MTQIYLKHVFPQEDVEALREHLCERAELILRLADAAGADYEILVDGVPTRDDLTRSPRLRAVIVPWAGVPIETLELLRDFPRIALHSLHYNSGPTAEMALALLLAAAKLLVPFDRRFRQGRWGPIYPGRHNGVLLDGKTVLILGYGRVGQRIAASCRAMGMRVIAMRRSARPDPGAEIHGPDALTQLLPRADVLMICLPHTSETAALIGAREIDSLPAGAILVNVARGPIVDEAALYHALISQRLFGAGLDVWYQYPTQSERDADTPVAPSRFPFHTLDNVVMMPHRAGWSEETEGLRIEHLAELLNAAARDEPIPSQVDLASGY